MDNHLQELHTRLNEEILQFLLEYKESNPSFRFATRLINRGNRLNEGYWFHGQGDYIFVGFYKLGDGNNKTKTIGFVVSLKEQKIINNYIEIVYPTDKGDNYVALHNEIKQAIEALGILEVKEIEKDRKYFMYFKTTDWQQNLFTFLNEIKPIIDSKITNSNLKDTFFFSDEEFNSNLEKIKQVKNFSEEETFVNLLKKVGQKNTQGYFDFATILIQRLGVSQDDKRLSFTCRDFRRLSIIVGHRYCFNFSLKNTNPWHFIQKEPVSDISIIEQDVFKENNGAVSAYYNVTENIENIKPFFDGIYEASKTELDRTQVSHDRRANIKTFEKAIFDTDYRNKLFQLAFENPTTNYWLFQCNPADYDFEKAVNNDLLKYWTITAHKEKIKPKDKVILWLSGKDAGCYALAEITSEPEFEETQKDRELWKTIPKEGLRAGIKVTHNLTSSPILWQNIKSNQVFKNLNVGLRGTNFVATQDQYNTLLKMVEIQPLQPMALNQILYGPPGTGKTYSTVARAYEIAKGIKVTDENYTTAKTWFKSELAKEEDRQLDFITFHQNYSYEDFVMGLKPDLRGEGLGFSEHRGVFFEICQRALTNLKQSSEETVSIEPEFGEVFEEFIRPLVEENQEITVKMKRDGFEFNITTINDKNLNFRKQSGGTAHTLSLRTLEDLFTGNRGYNLQGLGVYYYPIIEILKNIAHSKAKKVGKVTLKNYVLVIDEINRANISRVFGELITLIEDDKRWGNENEMEVRMPDGKTKFTVPKNLHIIGTMNTADKSIALLDIALRRRFEFVGLFPNKEKVVSEYQAFFETLNNAIKQKKGVDFMIGHAYFMSKGNQAFDFKSAMNTKVIPLLNEYFYNPRSTDDVKRIINEAIEVLNKTSITNKYEVVEENYQLIISEKNASN